MLLVIQNHPRENIQKNIDRVLETVSWRTESPKLSATIIGTGFTLDWEGYTGQD